MGASKFMFFQDFVCSRKLGGGVRGLMALNSVNTGHQCSRNRKKISQDNNNEKISKQVED